MNKYFRSIRILIFGVVLFSLALSACAPAAPAVKAVKFQMSWVPDTGQFVPFVAVAQGYFKEEGLEVELVPGGPEVGKLAISLADTGKVDLASMGSAQNFIKANLEGANTIAVAQTFQASPAGLLYIVKYPDGKDGKSILKTSADARGKRLGIQSGGLLTWDMMAQKAGLKKEDYTIVSVGADPTPLIDGTIDAFWGYDTNIIPALKAKGYEIGHLKAFDAGVPTPGDFIFVNKDYLKNNKDTVCRFMKAFEKAAAYGVDHPESAVNYAMDKYSKDFKLVKAEQENMASVIITNYLKKYRTDKGFHYVNLENWQITIDQLYEQKAITTKPALKDVVTTEISECVTKK